MSKILFITAPYHANVVEVASRWVPLYYVYLAGAARQAGVKVDIYDAMTKKVGMKEIEEKIRKSRPDYIGVMSITCTSPDALEVVNKIGNLGEHMPEQVKKAIDEISLEADHFKGDITKCPVTRLKKFVGIGKK